MKSFTWLSLCLCIVYMFSKSSSVLFTEKDLELRGKFCGPDLSSALSIVCRGKYNSPRKNHQKKSGKNTYFYC